MTKVSVIMPVYNVEEYLEECLNSVIHQTLKEIEIICVNDGSTDGSLQILKKYADLDKRIRIINKENTGYGHSVNCGIDEAQGDYIGVVETDDYIDASMFEELYHMAVLKNADVVKADSRYFVNDHGRRAFFESHIFHEEYRDLYNKVINYHEDIRVFRSYVYTWAGIYKRHFLNEKKIRHNESPGASYQDNGFWFQVNIHAERMYFMDKAFYNLRRDNPNSSIYSKEKVFALCEEYDFIKNKVLGIHPEREKEILCIVFLYRVRSYIGTLARIDKKYRQIFYDKVREDFQLAFEKGEVDCCQFDRLEWDFLFTVLSRKKVCSAVFACLSEPAKNRLEHAEKIYIYGAGMWGKTVLERLDKYFVSDKIAGFIVTKKQRENDFIEGIGVSELKECDVNEKDLVILAVSDKAVSELVNNLNQIGFTNYMLKNELI